MDPEAARPARRTLRDWIADIVLFVSAACYGILTSQARLTSATLPDPAWLFDLDQIVGGLGCIALWLRRRWPVHLAVVLVALSTFSELVAGAMLASLLTVAIHRRPRTTGAIFALSLVAAAGYAIIRPEPDTPRLLLFLLGVAVQGAVVGWGLYIRSRRQLVDKARAEARLRAEQVQHEIREQIAREMHDVLGHRLSLLSVHAGALEYRPDAPREEIAQAAKVIRENAHQALQDLREVIGVLRAPVGELPQPTLSDLSELIAESVRGGMRVSLRTDLPSGTSAGNRTSNQSGRDTTIAAAVPDGVGRTAYRIVQEGLTNVRKHAPGAEVNVAVAGGPGRGLTVEVRNGAPQASPKVVRPKGQGQGLVGLAERAALAGGRLEHGPTASGGFRLAAWLPWPA